MNTYFKKDIYLKTLPASSYTVKKYMDNFFRRLKSSTNIIKIRTLARDEFKFYSLGNSYVIDLNNKTEVKKYIDYVVENNNLVSDNYAMEGISAYRIFWIDVNEDIYQDFLNRNNLILSKDNQFELLKSLKLPKNIDYSQWGKETRYSPTFFALTSIKFNKLIANIMVDLSIHKNKLRIEMKDGSIYYIDDIIDKSRLLSRDLNIYRGKDVIQDS